MTTETPPLALRASEPIETCPKLPGVPYVLLVAGAPVVASYSEDGWVGGPAWELWLDTQSYGVGTPVERVQGWFPIALPAAED
jgi:hypothetical protein